MNSFAQRKNQQHRNMSDGEIEDKINRYLGLIVAPILLVVGSLGNLLSIAVMSRSSMRASQASVYLIALSLADLMVLYTGLLRLFIKEVSGTDIRNHSTASCRLHATLVYMSLDTSVWILVAFTGERILSVFRPYKVKNICTRVTSLVIIVVIIVVMLVLNSHFFYGLTSVTTVQDDNTTVTDPCTYINSVYKNFLTNVWPWIDFCVFNLVPFLLLSIGNTCIAVRVVMSRRRAKRHGNRAGPSTDRLSFKITDQAPPMRTSARNERTSSMTAILLLLNMVFLATTTPVSVFFIIQDDWGNSVSTPKEIALFRLTFTVVNLVQYVNNSINFILYCITGSRFRKEL
ncbi:hypothetical protein EGW08_013789, partial [Elysia chlorotica]